MEVKQKSITKIIISLIGVGFFAYPLLTVWYSGFSWQIVIGTVVGLFLIGGLTVFLRWRSKKIAKQVREGISDNKLGKPMLFSFILFTIVYIGILLLTTLPPTFFIAFASSSFLGGFLYWFFREWIDMKKQNQN